MTTNSRRLQVEDLANGSARGFEPLSEVDTALFVVRSKGTLYAYRDRCPHQGTRLPWRQHAYLNREGNRIVCSAHGAEFEIESGRCLSGPCLGQSLDPLRLELTEHGEIQVSGSSSDGGAR